MMSPFWSSLLLCSVLISQFVIYTRLRSSLLLCSVLIGQFVIYTRHSKTTHNNHNNNVYIVILIFFRDIHRMFINTAMRLTIHFEMKIWGGWGINMTEMCKDFIQNF